MRHRGIKALVVGLWPALLAAIPALAQEGPTLLQFSFSNPGARSLGFGGAFVALADDATAAFANPAGLVQLTRPEVSIEGRHWSFTSPFTAGGRASGPPTGIGLDTVSGLRFGESRRQASGVSFLSVVYPFEAGSLAFYRHQLANFEALAVNDGLFTDVPDAPGFVARFPDQRTFVDLEVVTIGVAGSFRLGEAVSLGIGLGLNEIELEGGTEVFAPDLSSLEAFFAPNPFVPERLTKEFFLTSDDTDLTLNLGFLWQLSERWSLGGVYRFGLEFEARLVQVAGPATADQVPAGTLLQTASETIDLPDVLGLGVAYRAKSDAFTASFEWDRVEYSMIVDSLSPMIFDVRGLVLQDADEFHIGFEYAFLGTKPLLALRAGAWLDPDHQIAIRGEERSLFDRAIFQPGDDEVHVSFGAGLVLRHIQLDFAADFSDQVDTVAMSAIYGF